MQPYLHLQKRYLPRGRRYPALGQRGRDGRGGPVDRGLPRLVGVQSVVDRVGVPRRGRYAAWKIKSREV